MDTTVQTAKQAFDAGLSTGIQLPTGRGNNWFVNSVSIPNSITIDQWNKQSNMHCTSILTTIIYSFYAKLMEMVGKQSILEQEDLGYLSNGQTW